MNLDYIHFKKDFYPFWSFLGLDENCHYKDVLERSKTLSSDEKNNPYIRFAWKVLKDPFYHDVYKKYRSIETVYDSGFFIDRYQDNNDLSYDLNFLSTPFDKIIHNIPKIENDKPNLVLLSTGGFSPVHNRHVDMMEFSKTELESLGYHVLGGYFSPSHDNYVSNKHGGTAGMNIEKRVFLLEQMTKDSSWLYVDKWEAYYNRESINFTDAIVRLEEYLNHHIKTKNGIKVCYVFGADNAGFARTFYQNGYGICISRDGYNKKYEQVKSEFKEFKNIFFIEQKEQENHSSSLVRKGNFHLMNEAVRDSYLDITSNRFKTTKKDVYAIRNDLEETLNISNIAVDSDLVKNTLFQFKTLLSNVFEDNITTKELSLKKQHVIASTYSNKKSISLDVFIKGDYSFEISRLFEMASSQFKPKSLVNRPGSFSLEVQLENIETGNYLLIEDDVASGNTLKKLFELLPSGVKIDEMMILSQLDDEQFNKDYYDIVDMRDFIFGLKNSGLVVSLPNKEQIRAPYVLPYVSPVSRARVPLSKELLFSLEVWKMNKTFFESFKTSIKLSDMDESFIKLMTYIGFNESDHITDIIDWHINKLKRAVKSSE